MPSNHIALSLYSCFTSTTFSCEIVPLNFIKPVIKIRPQRKKERKKGFSIQFARHKKSIKSKIYFGWFSRERERWKEAGFVHGPFHNFTSFFMARPEIRKKMASKQRLRWCTLIIGNGASIGTQRRRSGQYLKWQTPRFTVSWMLKERKKWNEW